MNESLTLKEVYTKIGSDADFDYLTFESLEYIFNLIREGTIVIPNSKDWPLGANYIRTSFFGNEGYVGDLCQDIRRPEPEWIPIPGDKAFVNQNGYLCVGLVKKVEDGGIHVKVGRETRQYPSHLVKPFSEDKIGFSWEEI